MKNLPKKIENFNNAFQYFKVGLSLLKENGYNNEDLKTYLWRLEKAILNLERELLKEINKEVNGEINTEFDKIVKKYKE